MVNVFPDAEVLIGETSLTFVGQHLSTTQPQWKGTFPVPPGVPQTLDVKQAGVVNATRVNEGCRYFTRLTKEMSSGTTTAGTWDGGGVADRDRSPIGEWTR